MAQKDRDGLRKGLFQIIPHHLQIKKKDVVLVSHNILFLSGEEFGT
jgi:hypothetical protein